MSSSTKTQHNRILITVVAVLAILMLAGCASLPFAASAAVSQVKSAPEALVATPQPPVPVNDVEAAITLAADQEALADLYTRISPSVVNIQVTQAATQIDTQNLPNPFNFPFELPNSPNQPNTPVVGEGTGWIYDTQGHIVTNNHVIENAESILVTFSDGLWAEAELVAADPQADLAVIKVDAPEGVTLTPLPLADSDALRVGYSVIAIGTPFGLDSTMTTGIVSALGRDLPVGDAAAGQNYSLPEVIQTDAAINPGNSGGPLLNLAGEVVGVNFAIESPVRGSSGVGFAIPTSVVRVVVPDLIASGAHKYAYLGISGGDIGPQMTKALGLNKPTLGAYVATVTSDGPAEKAGVQGGSREVQLDNGNSVQIGGDIITAIDGQPVRQFNDLVAYLVTDAKPGQKVTLTVLRDGKSLDLDVTLGERPATMPTTTAPAGGITARAAIGIARDYAVQQKLLDSEITETVVTQEEQDGRAVWMVELNAGSQTATISIDAQSGEVLNAQVR